jgi:hypothetical protein
VRRQQAAASHSRMEFQWFDAKNKIEATAKQIYITSTDKIVNLPTGLSKTCSDYLSSIIRGRQAASPAPTPRGGSQASPPPSEPPLLRNMTFRGGSYAILKFFGEHPRGTQLTRDQICRGAQRFCDDQMILSYHHAGGRAGMMKQGWKSMDTLVKHQLVHRIDSGATFTSYGFRSNGVHQFVLTAEGERFIPLMRAKFGGGSGGGGSISSHSGVHTFSCSLGNDEDEEDPWEDDQHGRQGSSRGRHMVVSLEHPSWYVLTVPTEKKAIEVIESLASVCECEALLCRA